ncbi:MAG TPA: DUF3501 family protein, partial [Acidimicrobiales bacterium]|nr:DUF3501 family protein [Acidimicrobiales bacterium]
LRRHVIALKRRRRVPLGDVVTLLFENRQTVRFQVQEVARAERIISDAGIESELAIYNPLVPEPGQLCATLFIELTSRDALGEWLPRLLGIERSVALRLPGSELARAVVVDARDHQHTRDQDSASVHYLRWDLAAHQVERFATGPVTLIADHAAYEAETRLPDDTRAELTTDLRHGG